LITFQTIDSRNTAIQSSTKAIHQETVKIVDAQLKEMATQMADLDQFVTRARSQNEEHHIQNVRSLNDISTGVLDSFSRLGHDLRTSSSILEAFSTDVETRAAEVNNLVLPQTEDARQRLKSLRENIEAARLMEYTPTGETPSKREWTYPTALPCTETHQLMIAKLRGLPDTTGSKTPSSSHTSARSPRKIVSPRKMNSSSKLPSPTKGRIFVDAAGMEPAASAKGSVSQPTPFHLEGFKGGLKEMDINIVQRPASADDHFHPEPVFSKSVGGGQPPPLKRHATADLVGDGVSRLPTKPGGRGKSVAVMMDGRENVNISGMNPLSQSLGPGSRHGRRLRSSPQQ